MKNLTINIREGFQPRADIAAEIKRLNGNYKDEAVEFAAQSACELTGLNIDQANKLSNEDTYQIGNFKDINLNFTITVSDVAEKIAAPAPEKKQDLVALAADVKKPAKKTVKKSVKK